ncbi:DUF1353 domain-containing protein [Alteromonas gracilis]|uniref:DUF1353 domain-containing protein n=1 Tax=Alteromonas gracilis TaxID=1479524 RepID=UPI0037362325
MYRCLIIFVVVSLFSGCATSVKSPLSARVTGDGKYWIVQEPLKFELNGEDRYVPKGFVTDFASVPRSFWVAFPPCDIYTPAAVVHDYLYWMQFPECDQECADSFLNSAMESADVPRWKRVPIYMAVRVAGSSAWSENTELNQRGVIRFVPEGFVADQPNETWAQIEKRLKEYLEKQSVANAIHGTTLTGRP